MRTALLLLFLLALASVPGGFLPQRTLNPVEVRQYFADHPTLAPVLDRLSLFDVFASPVVRGGLPAAVRQPHRLPRPAGCGCTRGRCGPRRRRSRASLAKLPASDRWETGLADEPARAAAAPGARAGLAGRRASPTAACRPRRATCARPATCCSTSAWSRCSSGSRWAGCSASRAPSWSRRATGSPTRCSPTTTSTPAGGSTPDRLVPFSFTLDDFRAPTTEDGRALTFDADVDWAPPAGRAATRRTTCGSTTRCDVGGAKVYLLGHGYAPRVLVRDARATELDADACPACRRTRRFLSTCTIKVPERPRRRRQRRPAGLRGRLHPDDRPGPRDRPGHLGHPAAGQPGADGRRLPRRPRPRQRRAAVGLRAGRPSGMQRRWTARRSGLRPGETWQLPGGGSLTFVGTTEWATFQVTQDPGKLLALGRRPAWWSACCSRCSCGAAGCGCASAPRQASPATAPVRWSRSAGWPGPTRRRSTTEFADLAGRLRAAAPADAPDDRRERRSG